MEVNEEQIISTIADIYGVEQAIIFSRNRTRAAAEARHAIAWHLYTQYRWTLARIGRLLDRDHSTVIHSIEQFRNLLYISDAAALEVLNRV